MWQPGNKGDGRLDGGKDCSCLVVQEVNVCLVVEEVVSYWTFLR